MNYKNENLINRNRNKFIKNNSVLISLMEVFNKKVNEGVDFRRTTSSCVLNTDGEKPLIIYFKSPKEYKPKYDKNQNVQNFMSDGGLNQKNKKFLNLLSEYPINYKFKSPIKYKKEKLNEIKKRRNARIKKEKLGYEPVVVLGNSEFELDMETATLVNYAEAKEEGALYEEIQQVRNKISNVHSDIEQILYNANLAMGKDISEEQLVQIKNIVQELEKATINLGTAVTEHFADRWIVDEEREDELDRKHPGVRHY